MGKALVNLCGNGTTAFFSSDLVRAKATADIIATHIGLQPALHAALRELNNGLAKDKTNVVYCYTHVCHLAAKACVEFASKGFPVMEMDGGFEAWRENELDIEHESFNRLKKRGERVPPS